MSIRLSLVTLVVPSYDEGIAFFRDALGFDLLEDTDLGYGKRWMRVVPPGGGAQILLARPVDARQADAVGAQCGGRVGFFLEVDDFARTHQLWVERGVVFQEDARNEPYGTVAVFSDPWGNRWDLIEPRGDGS